MLLGNVFIRSKERRKLLIVIFSIMCLLIVCIILQGIHLQKQKSQLTKLTKWHDIALTDDLTQIPNRSAYSNYIKKFEKSGHPGNYHLVLFDIDDFKEINDTKGHLAGDNVLRKCATVLREVFMHSGSTVYRIGGDEFAVLGYGANEQQIIDLLFEVSEYENNGLGFTVSKGYCISDGKKNFDYIFRMADEMLYADKINKTQHKERQFS